MTSSCLFVSRISQFWNFMASEFFWIVTLQIYLQQPLNQLLYLLRDLDELVGHLPWMEVTQVHDTSSNPPSAQLFSCQTLYSLLQNQLVSFFPAYREAVDEDSTILTPFLGAYIYVALLSQWAIMSPFSTVDSLALSLAKSESDSIGSTDYLAQDQLEPLASFHQSARGEAELLDSFFRGPLSSELGSAREGSQWFPRPCRVSWSFWHGLKRRLLWLLLFSLASTWVSSFCFILKVQLKSNLKFCSVRGDHVDLNSMSILTKNLQD